MSDIAEDLCSSTIVINIIKSLTTEYNENVSTKFIQYVKDEDFDQETIQNDICDDDELENCSIAIHLIEEFPAIFNTIHSQQKLLFILKSVIKGEPIEKQSFIKVIFYDTAGQINHNKSIMKSFASDSTLKAIAQHFEDEMEMKDNNNPPKVHLWLRFGQIKSIYSSNNFNITLTDLQYQDHKRWVEVPDDYLTTLKLNAIFIDSLQYENVVLIERKQSNNIWPAAKRGNWKHNIQIGDIIDAKNTKKNNRWYEALIRYIYPDGHESANFAIVHYIGLNAKYDEKIYIYDELSIKKRHSYSCGPYRKPCITNGDSVGIINSGNKDFMIAVIQPLARSPQLTEYFLNDEHLNQINKTNPLGWKGQVAEEWAALIHDIFSGKSQAIDITNFQSTIGKIASRITGYGSHSGDFLSFMLDGLHEDLNQIHTKPFTETALDDGRPSEIVATENWKAYLKRNQSEINDIFHFQCKQYYQCNDCGNETVRFDTLNMLCLAIPNYNKQLIKYTWIDCGTFVEPAKYVVETNMDADICLLKSVVAEKHKVPKQELFVCEIDENKIYRQFKNNDKMFECMNTQKNDIFVYNVPKPSMQKDTKKQKYQTFMVNNKRTTSSVDVCLGFPLLITLSLSDIKYTYKQIRYELWHLIKPYLYDKLNIDNNALPFEFIATWDNGNIVEIVDKDEKFEYLRRNNLTFEINWIDPQQYNAHPYYSAETKYDDDDVQIQNGKEAMDLLQCLELYSTEKALSEIEAGYCAVCKNFTMTTQISNIWSCSDIFVIKFERFIEHENNNYTEIIGTKINFPLIGLDLSSHVKCHDAKRDALYDCYGITVHFGGNGISGGHWSSYAKSLYNNQWYYFNDRQVEKINNPLTHNSFNSNNVHILYYQKHKPSYNKHTSDSACLFEYKVKY